MTRADHGIPFAAAFTLLGLIVAFTCAVIVLSHVWLWMRDRVWGWQDARRQQREVARFAQAAAARNGSTRHVGCDAAAEWAATGEVAAAFAASTGLRVVR